MRTFSPASGRRNEELLADLATVGWVVLWLVIGLWIYRTLAELASVGTSLGEAGTGLENAGATIRLALSQIPIIGEGVADLIAGTFEDIGTPLVEAGADLEQLLPVVAALQALLVVAVALIGWFVWYLPWRRGRAAQRDGGRLAIVTSPALAAGRVSDADLQRILATRAINRLDYGALLAHSPDPIGDYAAGRYDRLAEAELASVGLTANRERSGG